MPIDPVALIAWNLRGVASQCAISGAVLDMAHMMAKAGCTSLRLTVFCSGSPRPYVWDWKVPVRKVAACL